jgi:serine protease Do
MQKTTLIILSILCVLAGLSVFRESDAQETDRAVPISSSQVMLSYAPIVKKTAPAVVNIYTKRVVQQRINPFMSDPFFEQFFGGMRMQGLTREQVESSLGSGVIVESDGLIVTNAHVVKDAQEIMVVLSDRREFEAKVAVMDERSDIALLRVDAKGETLPHAPLKPSESLQVGDIVLAIGNPFGVGQTVTSGIVSALARSTLNINDFNFFIQTDAAINPGNSGGPLVSMDGGVVGINSAIYSKSGGSLGIGFAVPSEMVSTVIAAEKSGGAKTAHNVARAWAGITGQEVSADIAQSLGLARPSGVLITGIHPASPLLKEGLKVGDVITTINGREVNDTAELKFRLATIPLGDTATLEAVRKGESKSYTLKTVAPPDKPARDQQTLEGNHPLNGAVVANLNPAVAVELGLQDRETGVVVMEVARGSAAGRFLAAGDILLGLNGQDIKTVKDLKVLLQDARRGQGFALVLERGGQKTQVVIR